mgnify:CR=1 FL=1
MQKFATPTELQQHYKAIRARLRSAKPALAILPPPPRPEVKPAPAKLTEVRSLWPDELPSVQEFLRAVEIGALQKSTANAILLATVMEEQYGLERGKILGGDRRARCALHRQEWFYYVVNTFGFSLPKTGKLIGRDHTTVLYGLRRYEEYLQKVLYAPDKLAAHKAVMNDRRGGCKTVKD